MAALSPTAALTQENDGANDTQPESPPPALDDKPADGVDDDAEAQAEHARVLQIQNSLEEAREASVRRVPPSASHVSALTPRPRAAER